MKTKPAPRRQYVYSVVAYFGFSMEGAIPMMWTFHSTSIAAAKRKARRLGMGGRQVMTARAAQKILNVVR